MAAKIEAIVRVFSGAKKQCPPGGWCVPIRYLRKRQANKGPLSSVRTPISAVHVTHAAQVPITTTRQHSSTGVHTLQSKATPQPTSPDTAVCVAMGACHRKSTRDYTRA